jgi:hypothetical protein
MPFVGEVLSSIGRRLADGESTVFQFDVNREIDSETYRGLFLLTNVERHADDPLWDFVLSERLEQAPAAIAYVGAFPVKAGLVLGKPKTRSHAGIAAWALEEFDARLQTFAPEGHAA